MGADKPGDIAYLTKLAPCTVGVITAISPAHLELFGDIETLTQEKMVMHLHLDDPQGKWAIYNEDDPLLLGIRESMHARPLSYGFSRRADVCASELSDDIIFPSSNGSLGGVHFTVTYQGESAHIELPRVIGKQSVYSVLAGIAVGIAYGISLSRIADELRAYEPPKGRMRALVGMKDTLIIDDTYNSSPLAARAALDVLAGVEVAETAKKIAVLGDMLELGAYSQDEHITLGEYIARLGIDALFTVGPLAHRIADAAEEKGFDQDKILCFDNPILASVVLRDKIRKHDVILVKGSQGMRLEKVVKELMAEPLLASKVLVRQGKEWRK
jgi:UDP-N-acetylmuramoyl-tripeptide--D-alanyl-D-alanine ligase